jgi:hypothetical protein
MWKSRPRPDINKTGVVSQGHLCFPSQWASGRVFRIPFEVDVKYVHLETGVAILNHDSSADRGLENISLMDIGCRSKEQVSHLIRLMFDDSFMLL